MFLSILGALAVYDALIIWMLRRMGAAKVHRHLELWSLSAFLVGLIGAGIIVISSEPVLTRRVCVAFIAIASVVSFMGIYAYAGQMHLFCPHCGKFLAQDEAWGCGYCDKSNHRSLFKGCETCDKRPTGFTCPHCAQIVDLTGGKGSIDEKHLAKRFQHIVLPKTDDDIAKDRTRTKGDREFEILLLRLDSELVQERARYEMLLKAKKPRDEVSAIEEDYNRHKQAFLAVDEIVERETKAAQEKYKDNPDMLKRHLECLEAWKQRKL